MCDSDCSCAICSQRAEFKLDEFLIREIASNNAVIFAGAGISTENPNSSPHSLYTELSVACDNDNNSIPFPDLAQKVASLPDGQFKLVKIVQDRFDYIKQFAELRRESTKFFSELSTMPYFNTFITTNWDRHFEDYCSAKPFVYEQDMRFWDIPLRKVLKIHGTIDNYSTLIATRDDYNNCAENLRSSLIGGKLKELLNTKTCIFIGYSMTDDDFQEIFDFVRNKQGKFEKTHYFVSPNAHKREAIDNIVTISTDGTYFLKMIKEHFCKTENYIDDDIFDIIEYEFKYLLSVHSDFYDKFNLHKKPQILLSAMYQDGLLHGYNIILDGKNTGTFSDAPSVRNKLHAYEQKINDYYAKGQFSDAAYFRGYQNTLVALLAYKSEGKPILPPHYYYPKLNELSLKRFKKNLKKMSKIHVKAYKHCQEKVSKLDGDNFVIHHPPWG